MNLAIKTTLQYKGQKIPCLAFDFSRTGFIFINMEGQAFKIKWNESFQVLEVEKHIGGLWCVEAFWDIFPIDYCGFSIYFQLLPTLSCVDPSIKGKIIAPELDLFSFSGNHLFHGFVEQDCSLLEGICSIKRQIHTFWEQRLGTPDEQGSDFVMMVV